MTYRKKLIEVALPLEAINVACKEDKDRKTGTIRNLHKWFAPMPVPALRAMIWSALIDDPGDEDERRRLLDLVAALVESSVEAPRPEILSEARRLLTEAFGGVLPVVLDPFCGGGSTLVEAQRLGLPSCGSDLNPIPALISKVLTEFPPGLVGRAPVSAAEALVAPGDTIEGFIADVRHYARQVYEHAHRLVGDHYPLSSDGNPAIAWLWARTVPSPDPRFQGVLTPLVTTWSLARGVRPAYVEPMVDKATGAVSFEIRSAGVPQAPSKARCLFSDAPITFEYLRRAGMEHRLGMILMALATHGPEGRSYLPPSPEQIAAAQIEPPADMPHLPLPTEAIGFRVQNYGLTEWSELFTPRQQTTILAFADLVANVPTWVETDGGDAAYGVKVAAVLGLCVGKLAQFSSTQCLWKIDSRNGTGKAESAKFGRNDLPMTMDFVETNPFGQSVGDWMQIVDTACRALTFVDPSGPASSVTTCDARNAGRGIDAGALVVTDPPYFSAIGYANLSDFFYMWVRRAVGRWYPDLFGTVATPKDGELIAEPARHGSEDNAKTFFIDGFRETFRTLRRRTRPDLPMLVVYAFKEQGNGSDGMVSSSGWEAMLEAILTAGLAITGTWPIHGTGSTRLRGLGANALATYVVLVCRPRPDTAPICTRKDFVKSLREELPSAMSVLQAANIAPVDLAQAAIGPGMAVFSRYSKVIGAEGNMMPVRVALGLINQVLDDIVTERESELDSDTRWAIAWFEQFGFEPGSFGVAESLSKAKNTSTDRLVADGIVEAAANRVHLRRPEDLQPRNRPFNAQRLVIWDITHRLGQTLLTDGEEATARLLSQAGGIGDAARDLAYRLYLICQRKKWAKESLMYNSLVVAWPDLKRIEADQRYESPIQQLMET